MIFVLEVLGTVVFAISGALVGIQKKMDLFGVVILASTTAVGGGVMRDVILDIAPPTAFCEPIFCVLSLATGALVFVLVKCDVDLGRRHFYHSLFIMADAVGLGLFTVIGVRTALTSTVEPNAFLSVFTGVTTGVGGGVLRDVFAREMPYIFTKHVYASASIVGAVICTLLWSRIGSTEAMILGALSTVALRGMAARYQWSLPKAE